MRDLLPPGLRWVLVSNYMIDIGWQLEAAPALLRDGLRVVIVHGDRHAEKCCPIPTVLLKCFQHTPAHAAGDLPLPARLCARSTLSCAQCWHIAARACLCETVTTYFSAQARPLLCPCKARAAVSGRSSCKPGTSCMPSQANCLMQVGCATRWERRAYQLHASCVRAPPHLAASAAGPC